MLLLAFETSAKAASAALLRDGALLGEYYQNSGQTHSRTVMKLAADLLENCDLAPKDVDLVAWANGPGSFTGVRIGAAAAKGFCWGLEAPCVPVSTLEAMAYSHQSAGCTVCACMDARRAQVYNAIFSCRGAVERLRDDRAISLEELAQDLAELEGEILLVGDGAQLTYDTLSERLPALRLAPEHLRQQRASGVALAAWAAYLRGEAASPAAVAPNYLRLSQAERERLARQAAEPAPTESASHPA